MLGARMRAALFITLPFVAPALAQAPPQAPISRQMGSVIAEFQPTFKLLRWKVDQPSTFESQDEIVPLLDFDLSIVALNDRSKARWGGDAAWGLNPRWGLGTPEGRVLQIWDREPTPQEITTLMRSQGWMPFQDRLENFLREHPDQGEAHVALVQALTPKLMRTLKEVPGGAGATKAEDGSTATVWTVDPEIRGTFTGHLKKLISLQGWSRQQGIRFALAFMLNNDELASAVLDADLRRDLREGIEAEIRRTPSDVQLWNLYASLCGPGDASAAKALLLGMDGPPGQAWPPAAAAVPMGDILGQAQDWTGLEGLATWAVSQVKHTPGASGGGFFGRNPEGSWTALGLWAAWEQGRHEDVFRALDEQLKTPSPGLMQVLGRLRGSATEDERKRLADLFRGSRGSFREAFQTPEPLPPVRVLKVAEGGGASSFSKLSQHPAFDAWGGDELAWGDLSAEALIRVKPQLQPGAQWAVLRGEEVLASGAELPAPADFAQQLRGLQSPRLEALNAYVKTHPNQVEARRARMGLLRSRMPHPRLEMPLLEDARTLGASFRAGEEWTPNVELWLSSAKRVVPELELQLGRWPSNADTWEAWVEWSALLPSPTDPVDLLNRLPIFHMREWMGTDAGPLPLDAAARVAKRLKALNRWKELEAWCRAFWEGGLRKVLPDLLSSSGNGRFMSNTGEGALQRMGSGLLQPWIEALEHTKAKGRIAALRQDLDEVQPGLAKRLLEKVDAKEAPRGRRG
jgi:hypothetical protein